MNFHLISIGGDDMHNLALSLHHNGFKITGSDQAVHEPSKSLLQARGLLPKEFGWFPERIHASLDGVVIGGQVKQDNPELQRAREIGLNIYSFSEYLYLHSQNKTRVVIGGSRGKSAITSIILHVLKYHQKEVDYMVGELQEGFDTRIHLTEENDFILLEGEEDFSSNIDLRPKFHIYRPNIALLSGISGDDPGVFYSYENYLKQFRIFIDSIVNGGIIVYNAADRDLSRLVEETSNPIRKHPYSVPNYRIEEGVIIIDTPEGEMPIDFIDKDTLNNLSGAKWICQHMGVDEDDFYEAITTFKEASKKIENNQ